MTNKNKYVIGDKVVCAIEIRKGGYKYILTHESDPKLGLSEVSVQIVSIHYAYDGACPEYRVIIPDDFVGWQISEFHVIHYKVPSKFIGKHFWDVTEDYIIRKSKN